MDTIAMGTLNFRLEKHPDGLVLTQIKRESEIIPKQHTFAEIERIKTEFMKPDLEINADVSDKYPVRDDMYLSDLKQCTILPKKTEIVTGVSRSGRVMKKSSKLLDFEILRYGHKHNEGERHTSERNNASLPISLLPNLEMIKREPVEMDDDSSSCEEDFTDDKPWSCLKEKSTPKNIHNDGKMMTRARRKDKGRSRFTAYGVWSRDVRQQLLSENPNLDFPSISRKLGELWAKVPANEKYNLRRKAKRLTSKLRHLKSIETVWMSNVK